MATEPKSRRRRRKKILMKNGGSLYDATERCRITQAELRDYVRDGGLFEARRQETGADCTYEVLQGVMGVGFLQNLLPGAGGPLAGLGGLAELARVLERNRADHGWDDWEESPRRKRRSEESDWVEDDGSGATRASKKHDNPDWATDPDFE